MQKKNKNKELEFWIKQILSDRKICIPCIHYRKIMLIKWESRNLSGLCYWLLPQSWGNNPKKTISLVKMKRNGKKSNEKLQIIIKTAIYKL